METKLSWAAVRSRPKSILAICVVVNVIYGCLYYVVPKDHDLKRLTVARAGRNPSRSSMETSSIRSALRQNWTDLPSVFKELGYADMELMRPMSDERPLFNFTLVPWKAQADASNFSSKHVFERLVNWSMIVVVKSHSEHTNRRQKARQMWGSFRYLDGVFMRNIFVLGKAKNAASAAKLATENMIHGDILQINQTEIYGDVGLKALAGMQWVAQTFPPHWIYTSADDDMLPDLAGLYKNLETIMAANLKLPREGMKSDESIGPDAFSSDTISGLPIVCGFVLGMTESPMRGRCKWCVDNVTYSLEHYPPFCHGGWYSMPVKLSNGIFNVSRHHTYYRMDDVWITGLLRLSYFNYINLDSYFGRNKTDRSIGISQVSHMGTRHVPNEDEILKHWKEMEPDIIASAREYLRL